MKAFFDDLAVDVVEERVVEYVIREVNNGRSLLEVIKDPYVRNRLSGEKVDEVLENPEVLEAFERDIAASFRSAESEMS
jgi:hypothetical protein